jgi:hypothetical protein
VSYDVRIDDKQLLEYMVALGKKTQSAIDQAVNKAAAQGMRKIAEEMPKRTGLLRKSWRLSSPSQYSRLIRSDSRYASVVEFGRTGGKRIYPRPPRKMLTVPIKDSVLTNTKSQIKKSALDTLFRRLKKPGKKTQWQIMEETGILLLKSAKMSRIKGQFILRDRIRPHISDVINAEMESAIRKAIKEAAV